MKAKNTQLYFNDEAQPVTKNEFYFLVKAVKRRGFSFSYDFLTFYSIPLCSICANQVFQQEEENKTKSFAI